MTPDRMDTAITATMIALAIIAAGGAVGAQQCADAARETVVDGITYVCDQGADCPDARDLAAVARSAREAFVGAGLLTADEAAASHYGVRVTILADLPPCPGDVDRSLLGDATHCHGITWPRRATVLHDDTATATWRWESRLHLADAVWPRQREADDVRAMRAAGVLP